MKAIAVRPGQKGGVDFIEVPQPEPGPGQALLRTLRCGVDGTDDSIIEGGYGAAPPGEEHLILGHEALAIVEKAPDGDLKPGDLVVPTVRRPDGCPNCQGGEPDMCLWGNYTERGIKGEHGFLCEYAVESPEYLVGVPAELEAPGVLIEPISVVHKGIAQAFEIQRRLIWEPQQAVVAGAGPIGLVASLLLRLRGLQVTTLDLSLKPVPGRVLARCGASYISTNDVPMDELPERLGNIDLIFEATGSSQVAFQAMDVLGTNGVLVLMSVSSADRHNQVPTDRINREFVLGNKLAVGAVNANPRDFSASVDAASRIEALWPGLLASMITTHLPLNDWRQAFDRPWGDVKTVIEL